jgi:hypothetical protein
MKWTIEYLEKDGIVSAKVSGPIDWEEHKKFAQEMFSLARKHSTQNIFIDFLEMVPALSVLQIDDLPKVLKEAGAGSKYKIAALHDMSSPHSSDFTFFKNAASLMSLQVQIFSDKEAAIAWLKIDTPAKEKR